MGVLRCHFAKCLTYNMYIPAEWTEEEQPSNPDKEAVTAASAISDSVDAERAAQPFRRGRIPFPRSGSSRKSKGCRLQ